MLKFLSPNFNNRPDGIAIDTLIFHYTGMISANEALKRMCSPQAKVSAHYMIDEHGQIFQLVPEEKRAWHAGLAYWRGKTNINDRSIGIELENPGHDIGYKIFPEKQILSLIKLAKEIIQRYHIPARNILGHSDVAPARKKDPGELFNWSLLASNGIGLWPEINAMNNNDAGNLSDFESNLKLYGYDTSNLVASTLAFQRHFLPNACSGRIDIQTFLILKKLIELL